MPQCGRPWSCSAGASHRELLSNTMLLYHGMGLLIVGPWSLGTAAGLHRGQQGWVAEEGWVTPVIKIAFEHVELLLNSNHPPTVCQVVLDVFAVLPLMAAGLAGHHGCGLGRCLTGVGIHRCQPGLSV